MDQCFHIYSNYLRKEECLFFHLFELLVVMKTRQSSKGFDNVHSIVSDRLVSVLIARM